jgi:hypothetical protein
MIWLSEVSTEQGPSFHSHRGVGRIRKLWHTDCTGAIKEEIVMPNEADNSNTPKTQDDNTEFQQSVQEKLSRIAKRAAKRAGTTEQRYDEEHGIFTK